VFLEGISGALSLWPKLSNLAAHPPPNRERHYAQNGTVFYHKKHDMFDKYIMET
jgi:hypothetical protein